MARVPKSQLTAAKPAPKRAPKKKEEETSFGTRSERLAALMKFSEDQRKEKVAFRPASEVITRIKSVPTIFLGYDHATRVGGHPIERVTTIHGPSGHGKTAFALGLGLSFLQREHFFVHIDAELTTPRTWVEKLYGEHYFNHPGYFAHHPTSYEQTVDLVRKHAERIAEAKEKGVLPKNTSCLFVVDSVRKLVPQSLFDRLAKGAEESGIDGFGGRAAQMRAAYNAAWLDELVPLMHRTGCALMFLARESEDTNASAAAVKYKTNFKVGGGSGIIYDSSLLSRISRGAYITKNDNDPKAPVYGERHKITISKTKVAGKSDKKIETFFHTSNGVLVPEGFDRARDIVVLGKQFGSIQTSGSWLTYQRRRWQGENAMVKSIAEDADLLGDMEEHIRSKFDDQEPIYTEKTEEDEEDDADE